MIFSSSWHLFHFCSKYLWNPLSSQRQSACATCVQQHWIVIPCPQEFWLLGFLDDWNLPTFAVCRSIYKINRKYLKTVPSTERIEDAIRQLCHQSGMWQMADGRKQEASGKWRGTVLPHQSAMSCMSLIISQAGVVRGWGRHSWCAPCCSAWIKHQRKMCWIHPRLNGGVGAHSASSCGLLLLTLCHMNSWGWPRQCCLMWRE